MSAIITMVCGLVFFLFGMHVMSGSLEKMAGGKLEHLLKKMTANPFISVVLGAAITIAVQSSSATTVMLVGLVNSGIMKLSQTLFVVYGANIGTTVTSWILSLSSIQSDSLFMQLLKPENFSPLIALVGIAMMMLSHSDRKQSIGTVFVGFTVLIYGMEMMSGAVKPLANSPEFAALLTKFNQPLIGMLVGTLFTAVIQSSAASIGIIQALSLTGGITNTMAIPIVMGANIGTCITSLISSVGTNRRAKQVALSHVLINCFGMVVWLAIFYLARLFTGWAFFNEATTPFMVAFIHSAFNVLTVILLAPLTHRFERLVERLIPDTKEVTNKDELLLDVRLLKSPSVAVGESHNATMKMCGLAHDNVLRALDLLVHYDEKKAALVEKTEGVLDAYEDTLGTYLVQLSSQALSQKDSQMVSKMLHVIGDFERLGDHALNLLKTAREMYNKKIIFSDEAKNELEVLMQAVREIVQLTEGAYVKNQVSLATEVEPLEQVVDVLISRIRDNHIRRLRNGACTIEFGFVLSDLLTNCERISDHCSNVAVAIIEVEHNSFDTHRYLNTLKRGNEDFVQAVQKYVSKYSM